MVFLLMREAGLSGSFYPNDEQRGEKSTSLAT